MTAKEIFDSWSYSNRIMCDYRSRFDGVRKRLKLAVRRGDPPRKALQESISLEGYAERYPIIPEEISSNVPSYSRKP